MFPLQLDYFSSQAQSMRKIYLKNRFIYHQSKVKYNLEQKKWDLALLLSFISKFFDIEKFP